MVPARLDDTEDPPYSQSIQSFVLKSIDSISVGWSKIWIFIKIGDLLSALPNRIWLFSWHSSDDLFVEKKTPELSPARKFRWHMWCRLKNLCKRLVNVQICCLCSWNKPQQRLLDLMQKNGVPPVDLLNHMFQLFSSLHCLYFTALFWFIVQSQSMRKGAPWAL